ncbi:MAG: metal ABC transporter ATP-binding protein [Candidatus Hydrogenedentes bacterium]|nr:metal ABC transporter ATP-binding protein [Candidatus Hydrogenedentota bacterium]
MTANAISVRDVEVRLGGATVLSDISFDIRESSFVAIIGPNGAGKSTLLKALLGLVDTSRGTITIDGIAPRDIPAAWAGYVPQVKALDRDFPALAIELVATGPHARWPWRLGAEARAHALEALELAGAKHIADRPAGRLSGGELQRVYLARAFSREPKFILLDEPAAGLDVAGEADMYHIIESYQRKHRATVMMITHDWDGARIHASDVLLLNRTNIGFGPPDTVLNDQTLLQVFGHKGHTHPKTEGTRHD